MRIGMMADAYKPYVSGITNYIDLNKRALEEAGHEVYVFTFGDVDYKDSELRVIRNPGLPLADTGFYLSLRYKTAAKKLLQTMDVVHVHHPFLSGRLALHYCRARQIPIVFTNHTRYEAYPHTYLPILSEEVGQSLLRAYMPDFCETMDLVISPSTGMEHIMREFGIKTPIEVVPNGVELNRFHNAQPLARTEFGLAEKDILLVYTGRIAPEKNIEFLLQAFAGVAHTIPNVYLLIVGGGVLKQFEEDLRRLISELDISKRVRLTGEVAYDDIPAYLSMGDIFVTASVYETFGLTTLEAMATGLPVISINNAGASDLIEDGKTGFLTTNDTASFTARLTYLSMSHDLQKQMGRAAREASEQYSIERTTRIMLGHYSRLIQNTKPVKQKFDERLISILEEFLK